VHPVVSVGYILARCPNSPATSPAVKNLDSFDFKAIPALNKMQVLELELARCAWPYGDASIAYRLTD